jgi:ankyrin repeat protein
LRWVVDQKINIRNFTIEKRFHNKAEPMLHIAAWKGSVWLAQACLDCNDEDINATDFFNSTPLHIAVREGHGDISKLFLESGALAKINEKYKRKFGKYP